jgi:hypothetical protein
MAYGAWWLSWALTGEHLVQFAATLVQFGWATYQHWCGSHVRALGPDGPIVC